MEYHKSVLLHEAIEGLNIHEGGTYADMTYGGGGHSRAILDKVGKSGKLYAFDQDENALQNKIPDERLVLIHQNFDTARDYLLALGVTELDGVLADLGVSSFQLNDDESGFSYRKNIELDMRMDKRNPTTAADLLNTYTEKELQDMFQKLGEVRNAKTLAQRIVEKRQIAPFRTTDDLNPILEEIRFGRFEPYAAPIYQALRMEVNGELDALEKMMRDMSELVAVGGSMAIITFHSLEDRYVKNFMKHGTVSDEVEKDIFGKAVNEWHWKTTTKKPIEPSEAEIALNPRSRSAKLRVMTRIN